MSGYAEYTDQYKVEQLNKFAQLIGGEPNKFLEPQYTNQYRILILDLIKDLADWRKYIGALQAVYNECINKLLALLYNEKPKDKFTEKKAKQFIKILLELYISEELLDTEGIKDEITKVSRRLINFLKKNEIGSDAFADFYTRWLFRDIGLLVLNITKPYRNVPEQLKKQKDNESKKRDLAEASDGDEEVVDSSKIKQYRIPDPAQIKSPIQSREPAQRVPDPTQVHTQKSKKCDITEASDSKDDFPDNDKGKQSRRDTTKASQPVIKKPQCKTKRRKEKNEENLDDEIKAKSIYEGMKFWKTSNPKGTQSELNNAIKIAQEYESLKNIRLLNYLTEAQRKELIKYFDNYIKYVDAHVLGDTTQDSDSEQIDLMEEQEPIDI